MPSIPLPQHTVTECCFSCACFPCCSCGYAFCSTHRHAQDHACPFDYATFDKANLAKANTKVRP